MPNRFVVGGITVLMIGLGAAVAYHRGACNSSSEQPFEGVSPPTDLAPMCPWRNPEQDMTKFFPAATSKKTETLILSGLRVELEERLGRKPLADEHSLFVHRIVQENQLLGSVLTRRVKGEFGAIEIVLAVAKDLSVRGVRLQRLREPAAISVALQSDVWLGRFQGKSAEDFRRGLANVSDLPPDARTSGRAIASGIESLLILISVAQEKSAHSIDIHH